MIRMYRDCDTNAAVHAVQFTGNFGEIELFVGGDAEWRGNQFVVAGPEGALRGADHDWIVRGHNKSFFVVSDTIFDQIYEEVPSSAS